MPRDFPRHRRIGEEILRTLADLVRRELKDPRVGLVTFTAVEVTADLAHAKVYFLPFGSLREVKGVQEALAHAAGFLRWELKTHMKIRHVPELSFLPDESIERGVRLTSLISTAVAEDTRRHVEDPAAGDPDAPAPASEPDATPDDGS